MASTVPASRDGCRTWASRRSGSPRARPGHRLSWSERGERRRDPGGVRTAPSVHPPSCVAIAGVAPLGFGAQRDASALIPPGGFKAPRSASPGRHCWCRAAFTQFHRSATLTATTFSESTAWLGAADAHAVKRNAATMASLFNGGPLLCIAPITVGLFTPQSASSVEGGIGFRMVASRIAESASRIVVLFSGRR